MLILTLLVIALMISQMCFWYVLKGLMQENNELHFKEDMSALAIKLTNTKIDSLADIVFLKKNMESKVVKSTKKAKKAKKA